MSAAVAGSVLRVALLGNPNTGKTTLFNRLTGLRHKTGNFPGTTLEARDGRFDVAGIGKSGGGEVVDVVDLPGIYSLELQQLEAEVCRGVLSGQTALKGAPLVEPDGIVLVLDATNLSRNLSLAGEALRRRLPTVVALNMIDLARKQGLEIDLERLSGALGCPVVAICARSGEGVDTLKHALVNTVESGVVPTTTPPGDDGGLRAWADAAFAASVRGRFSASEDWTDRTDRVLTHPVFGLLAFVVIMALVFAGIFWLAKFPMDWIEEIFKVLGSVVDWTWAKAGAGEEGLLHDLLKNGVIPGVGGVVVFLPQICLLFFLISVLEDTGYLARAAFVMDRVLRPFGLPGHAFMPLLSSHACALPGIMATRSIPDPKERLATILVAPFMTCSARLPVYVLLTGLLFADKPLLAGVAFVGCYALGIVAAMLSSLLARRTILRGAARPMALELPSYKRPSFRTAGIAAYDRGLIFLRKAGTGILAVSILLWWLGAFPKVGPSPESATVRAMATSRLEAANKTLEQMEFEPGTLKPKSEPEADRLLKEVADIKQQLEMANHLDARYAKANSMLGKLGKSVEPVLRPLGYDWQLSIGVLASFAAREVFVGTMSIVVAGSEGGDDDAENQRIHTALAMATRDDGKTLIFNHATCWSLLVYYVLAMQCIPTLVVTAREAGGVKWAFLQLAWMSAVAYAAASIVFQLTS